MIVLSGLVSHQIKTATLIRHLLFDSARHASRVQAFLSETYYNEPDGAILKLSKTTMYVTL